MAIAGPSPSESGLPGRSRLRRLRRRGRCLRRRCTPLSCSDGSITDAIIVRVRIGGIGFTWVSTPSLLSSSLPLHPSMSIGGLPSQSPSPSASGEFGSGSIVSGRPSLSSSSSPSSQVQPRSVSPLLLSWRSRRRRRFRQRRRPLSCCRPRKGRRCRRDRLRRVGTVVCGSTPLQRYSRHTRHCRCPRSNSGLWGRLGRHRRHRRRRPCLRRYRFHLVRVTGGVVTLTRPPLSQSPSPSESGPSFAGSTPQRYSRHTRLLSVSAQVSGSWVGV